MTDLYSLYTRLAARPVPSAFEAERHALLRELLSGSDLTLSADNLGHFYAHRPGKGKRILITTHADAPGIMASHITEAGFVRFGLLGSLTPAALCDREVKFLSGLRGIIRSEKEAPSLASELYIDIGAKDRAAALRKVRPGDPALLCDAPHRTGNRLTANYVSPSLPMALLAALGTELVSLPGDADVTLCFSAAAEVDHGAVRTAAAACAPELCLLVDVTPSGDTPGSAEVCPVKLGEGPVCRLADKGCICQPAAVDALRSAARTAGVSLQEELRPAALSEAAHIHLAGSGIPTAILTLPVRGIGTALQTADLRDARAALQVLRAMV